MTQDPRLSQLHYELISGLIRDGRCPTNPELASRMGLPVGEVEELLQSLADIHGLVLHPHVREPWVIHPFSVTPTINWIEKDTMSWWAPCVWCGLGVAVLAGGDCRIHTRYGAEGDGLTIRVENGIPVGLEDVVVHFAIPPARAWDNVHQHCSLVLPFRSAGEITEWCTRRGHPRGEAVPLRQVAELAKNWYGSHANADWRKWTMEEAQNIFHQSGLTSRFWDLGARRGQF